MGSQTFNVRYKGKSAQHAYKRAVHDANEEYGHQEGYSGHINATPGFKDATRNFKASGLSMHQYIDQRLDKLSKFDGAECICIKEPKTNTNKVKSQVEHIVEKGTKKWVLKFVAFSHSKGTIGSFDTKGEAVAAARKYTEESQNSSFVEMRKMLENGGTLTARITYKKSSMEAEGEYVFYGWASC
jgi:hypothetical protein